MKKIIALIITTCILISLSVSVCTADTINDTIKTNNQLTSETTVNLIKDIMKKSQIPGVSIVFIDGEQTEYLSLGYADKKNGIEINQDTFFEIGSMSKAFTGLGILLLEEQGKLSLEDPVSKYIPWFRVHFKGKYEGKKIDEDVELKISQLLYQTSGIPFNTIGNIPEGESDQTLEDTIRTLVGINLNFYPGDHHQYATLNYDILGYLIQIISNQSYEEYMQKNILEPLGMNNTYLFHDQAEKNGTMAQGYKFTFFQVSTYDAPRYRGNTPAGYIISNAHDMERWMRIQLGLIDIPDQYKHIIQKSHIGDTTVPSQGNYNYSAGWNINIKGKDIQHGGNNPNFSSMLIMLPNENKGICVLCNLNSNATEYLANNILNIIQKKEITKYTTDTYKMIDMIFSILIIASVVIGVLFIILLIKAIIELIRKQRIRNKLKGAKVAGLLLEIPLMLFLGFCVYYLPNILLNRLPWNAVNVWSSLTIMYGCILGYIVFNIFMIYVLLTFNFPKEKEKGYVALIPLSLINGISSALIIFTINESFNRNLEYSNELLVYFIFSLLFFVYTIKLLQGRMIVITNEIAYEKRMNMIDKIMCSSYQAIEGIGRDRIFSGLNSDCASLAQIPGIIISFASNMLTLIFCLSYLFTKSLWAFLASIGLILLNGFISFITSRIASKYWEKNRDIQDTYFGQMQDLVNGFKELVLNKKRRFAFWLDMKKYSRMSTELNKAASIKFLNYGLYNTLMYNIVFGVVVFLFPILITDIDVNQLRENLFIVFYMIGPFGAIAGVIPQLTQLNINVKRINKLIADLNEVSTGDETVKQKDFMTYPKNIAIKFEDVIYKYNVNDKKKDQEENEFVLGPINAEFKSGEITFITGGNGSGKSTLGKLITGLYAPQQGRILINNQKTELRDQNELFSSVYSDFNLFKKLYGIDCQKKKNLIKEYLDIMRIKEKISMNDEGEFKSIDLSTGQKKRLAFIISCLEDKPMMIFDEWAAEQDPEFRHYFYNELLPMLKKQGKGIIVITHDDRYFDRADTMLKLDRGLLINNHVKYGT